MRDSPITSATGLVSKSTSNRPLARPVGLLAAGNVVTVEPGLYFKDIGGVRLENTGAITTAGFDSFTQFPREFILR